MAHSTRQPPWADCGLFGILLGVSFAKPALLPWTLLVLLTFALFNLVLMQMVFAWVERWLAQRRTREIMGILFILLMLSFQLIGPLMRHFERPAQTGAQLYLQRYVEPLARVQGILPPGLAADAIAQAVFSRFMAAFTSLPCCCAPSCCSSATACTCGCGAVSR